MCSNHETDHELALDRMRHTCAHLMAAAIQDIWPKAKFGVGPTTTNGFYYDVDLEHNITEEDLQKIEQRMKELRNKKLEVKRTELDIDDAIAFMDKSGQTFKVELLNLLKTKGTTSIVEETGDASAIGISGSADKPVISFYQIDDFVDLCRGPHVENTKEIGAFKLNAISGAYWRGNAKNAQLQRIYGLCFADKQELDAEVERLEQVKLRDHRRLGKQLDIFTVNPDVGAGLPLWLPNGTILRDELEYFARLEEHKEGYKRVKTPIITKESLYYRSRHLPYYAEDMYSPMDIEGENYYLRPMNCPHHHTVYGHGKHSYRDLPLRLAEYGDVYRYEASGAMSGLMRARGFCQNDAHIYCRYDQAKQEFINVMHLHARYYKLFGIEDFYMRLSLPDLDKLDKYVDEPQAWLDALKIIKEAMDESGYRYIEAKGEAAFYGPKVDFMIKSAIGTEFAISTNQLDFLATKTFDLKYIGEDGEEHPVYVIHRAPLGSHERFVAFLLEHYAGNFPVWLAPTQVRVIPIADRHIDYAHQVEKELKSLFARNSNGAARVDSDTSSERMQKKIRAAQMMKIPYMLVVGDKEQEEGTVAVRHRSGSDLGAMKLEAFQERLLKEIETRYDFDLPAPKEQAA